MKILMTLVFLVLVAVFANAADLDSLRERFNTTVVGQCKPGVSTTAATGTTATGTGASNGSTAGNTGQSSGSEKPTTPPTPASSSPSTAQTSNTDTTGGSSSTAQQPAIGRKKRDASVCVAEENQVLLATDVPEFNKKLQTYLTCQTANCSPNDTLSATVKDLIKESGATTLTAFGTLLVVMLLISFFG